MKKKFLYVLFFVGINISLLFGQRFIMPDDIYYQKGDELMGEENIEEILDTNYNILILDPQVSDYEEGFIIYKNENEQNDTIYIFDDSDFYLNQTEK